MKVAFLGLGTMGLPMASQVLAGGHALTVWNRSAGRAEPLLAAGASWAPSPRRVVAEAEVVITMLADPSAVRQVLEGEEGVLHGLGPGAVLVDMSTVDPETARSTAEAAAARGATFLGAPVSGTRGPATEGSLLILAGGPAEVLDRVRPVLETMGRVRHLGPGVADGVICKLSLNALGAHMITGLAAVLVLAVKQGLPGRAVLEVIQAGAFSSPLYELKGPRMLAGDFRPDFTLELMRKDQGLVRDAARALGYPMPIEEAIYQVLDQAVDAGLGQLDLCAFVQLFEAWAGVRLTEG